MKILFITDFSRPQTNGIAIRCSEYITYFKEKNSNYWVLLVQNTAHEQYIL